MLGLRQESDPELFGFSGDSGPIFNLLAYLGQRGPGARIIPEEFVSVLGGISFSSSYGVPLD